MIRLLRVEAINLGQGFPDFQMNEELISLVDEAMEDGFNQYVPMQGYMPCAKQSQKKFNSYIILPLTRRAGDHYTGRHICYLHGIDDRVTTR
jgi:hypothetical protein